MFVKCLLWLPCEAAVGQGMQPWTITRSQLSAFQKVFVRVGVCLRVRGPLLQALLLAKQIVVAVVGGSSFCKVLCQGSGPWQLLSC